MSLTNSGLEDAAQQSERPATTEEPVYHLTILPTHFPPASLLRQLREMRREPKIAVPKEYYRGEVQLPATDLKPWYSGFFKNLRNWNEQPAPPAIPITAQAVEVPEIWQDYLQQPASWGNSAFVHALVVLALLLPYIVMRHNAAPKAENQVVPIDLSPYLAQLPASAKKAGGGGGGGTRSPIPASKGAIPKFAKEQLAPPEAKLPDIKPKLPVPPTLVGPPELKLPQMAQNITIGDPSGVVGPASNGPGSGGGIGTGSGGGIGSGTGGGLGPGSGGGTGGGPFSVGGNVSEPIPIYQPDPPYSEEARKAKFQGIVVLSIIVDAQGNVHDVQVVKPLGLGLDEQAVRTVQTWKFKPAQRNGVPVPVRVSVEISFRLF